MTTSSSLSLEFIANDICLVGEISHQSVLNVIDAHLGFSSQGEVVVNFSGVERSDSAGLALMVRWARSAKKANATIHFEKVPQKLLALAKMSSLDAILSISSS